MFVTTLELMDEVVGRPYQGTPSEGYFYFCRYPEGWKLEFFRSSDYTITSFASRELWWRERVAEKVTTSWARVLKIGFYELFPRLTELSQGFPGGVAHATQEQINYVGYPQVGPESLDEKVSRAFGLSPKPKWQSDRTSVSAGRQKEAIRRLLSLGEDWPLEREPQHCG